MISPPTRDKHRVYCDSDSHRVELIDSMGDDLRIVFMAVRTNGGRPASLTKREIGILNALMREKHGVPFEHVVFQFLIRTNIRVSREMLKHRAGVSISEASTRWIEPLEEDAYIPDGEAVRGQTGKRMEYRMEPLSPGHQRGVPWLFRIAYMAAWSFYGLLRALGVSMELAAYVLPLGCPTEIGMTINARALMHFLRLRTAPSALLEIREIADHMEEAFVDVLPVTRQVWVDNGRQTP